MGYAITFSSGTPLPKDEAVTATMTGRDPYTSFKVTIRDTGSDPVTETDFEMTADAAGIATGTFDLPATWGLTAEFVWDNGLESQTEIVQA